MGQYFSGEDISDKKTDNDTSDSEEEENQPYIKLKNIIIDFCGQIGAGKSHAIEVLKKFFNDKESLGIIKNKFPKLIPYLGHFNFFKEEFDDTKLNRYYTGMKNTELSVKSKEALIFQIHVITRRLEIANKISISKGVSFRDRSILEDLLFMLLHLESGVITKEDFDTYNAFLESVLHLINTTSVYIYFEASVDRCLLSIQERRKNKPKNGEEEITKDYLIALDKQYKKWKDKMQIDPKFVIIDYENYAEPEQLVKFIYEALIKNNVL